MKLIKIHLMLKLQKAINYAGFGDNQSRHLLHTTNSNTVLKKKRKSKCKLIAFIVRKRCPLKDKHYSLSHPEVHGLCENIPAPGRAVLLAQAV